MRIVLVGLTYPFRGGISHYTSLLFRGLQKRHEVTLISLKRQYPRFLFPGRRQEDESREKIDVENLPLIHPLEPWTWISAFKKIRALSPDLTLFQWWHPFFAPSFGSIALLLKRWNETKICFLCHNVKPHESTLLDRFLLKYAFHAPDCFIVHSEEDLRNLQTMGLRARIFKTPHPIYDVFKPEKNVDSVEAKKRLGVQGNVILFFGYIRKYKGLEYLIRAFPKVLKEMDCTLLIVGEIYGKKSDYLLMIEQSGAEGRIRMVDEYVPNEEVSLYFNAADVVILPYLSATQSGIIQIAYGFNKPVISTRVGGIPEAVADGETGFLIPPGDADALAESILRFYREKERINFRHNIEKAKEKFSWERMVEVIERICDPESVERQDDLS